MTEFLNSLFTLAAIIIWGRIIIDYTADAFAKAVVRNRER